MRKKKWKMHTLALSSGDLEIFWLRAGKVKNTVAESRGDFTELIYHTHTPAKVVEHTTDCASVCRIKDAQAKETENHH